jgi:erythromycin esterase
VNAAQHNWIRERATRIESCRPGVPLSHQEQTALDRIVDDAHVIAIGEMTHGAKEIFQTRERLLRFLIRKCKVTVLVIEACFAATRRLNEYLFSGEGNATEALACTEFWSCVNSETLHLMKWIRQHNASPDGRQQPVSVYGCDLQSIDGAKAELSRLVEEFGRAGQIASQDCMEAIAVLRSLPTDRELYTRVEPLISEVNAKNPDEAKIAQIQARRLEYMTGVRASAEPLARRLRELQRALPPDAPKEKRFFFQRCIRLIEQVVAFHFPDGLPLRDRYMAENVAAVTEHFVEDKLALLMHNLHVVRAPLSIRGEQFVSMGCHLANELAGDYKVIGSTFYHGKYLAAAGERENESEVAVAHTPRSNAFEFFLHEFADAEGVPDLLLDLSLHGSQEKYPWPPDMEMRIGETGSQGDYDKAFMRQRPEIQYDGLIFLAETTPITVLPEYFIRARKKWGSGSGAEY